MTMAYTSWELKIFSLFYIFSENYNITEDQ